MSATGCEGPPTEDERPPRATEASDRHLEETRIDGVRAYDGALLHVRRDTVRLPDGATAAREYVVHPGAVLIVPVHADGRLVVERQFRYPLNRVLVEFPAGKLDPGEAPLATAERELLEETGYTAKRWTHLGGSTRSCPTRAKRSSSSSPKTCSTSEAARPGRDSSTSTR